MALTQYNFKFMITVNLRDSKPKIQTITVEGQEIKIAVRAGKKDVTPLLFCNGIGANLELLMPFVNKMNKDIPAICFDVPGVGGSPAPVLPYRLPSLAKLLGKMLTQLEVEDFNVIGVSWGGALAQEIAHQYPTRCKKLILAATSAGMVMMPGKPSVLLKMATPLRYLDPMYMVKIAPEIYGGIIRRKPEEIFVHANAIRMRTGVGYFWQLFAGLGWTSVHWLPKLKQSVLVLAGDDDPIVPVVNAKLLNTLIRDSRLHIFKGGGHLFLLGFVDEALPLIEDFLNE